MFKGGFGLFGGGNMPRPGAQPQEKPYWQTTPGKLAMAGQIIQSGLGSRRGNNPMLDAMLQQSAMDQQMRAREQLAQQQRQWGNEDWYSREQFRLDNREPPKPGSFEWYQTATPEERATYDQYDPVTIGTWQGPAIVPRRPAIGSTVNMSELGPATIENTPAPELGANGMPATITRQQYQAIVNSLGQAKTDEWARRNNIRIGN